MPVNHFKLKYESSVKDLHLLFMLLAYQMLILFYWNSFRVLPSWDDKLILLDNKTFDAVSNPFLYWSLSAGFTKAWPAFYSLMWIFKKFFYDDVMPYHLILITAHFLNGLAIYSLLPKKNAGSLLLVGVFLFLPLHVETLSWVVQSATVFSTLFALLTLVFLKKADQSWRYYGLCIFLFLLSVAFKPMAILWPLAFLFYFKQGFFKKLLKVLPFIVISFYFSYLNINGIRYNKIESALQNEYIQAAENQNHQIIQEQPVVNSSAVVILPEHSDFWMSINHLGANTLQFAMSFLNIEPLLMVYPKPIFSWGLVGLGFIFIVLSLFLIFKFFKNNSEHLLWPLVCLLSFIPVSGLMYIPYMKFSLYCNHWYYTTSVALIMILASILPDGKRYIEALLILALAWLAMGTYKYAKIFNKHESLYLMNLKAVPDSVLLRRLLVETYIAQEDWYGANKYLDEAIALDPYNDILYTLKSVVSDKIRALHGQ